MWLFTKYGCFSIVCARKDSSVDAPIASNMLQVRARNTADLTGLIAAFPLLCGSTIIHTPKSDYCSRIIIPKDIWATVILEMTEDIEYDNFKSACHKKGTRLTQNYHGLLYAVWDHMNDYQMREGYEGLYITRRVKAAGRVKPCNAMKKNNKILTRVAQV